MHSPSERLRFCLTFTITLREDGGYLSTGVPFAKTMVEKKEGMNLRTWDYNMVTPVSCFFALFKTAVLSLHLIMLVSPALSP